MSLMSLNIMSRYLMGNTQIDIILPDLEFSSSPEDFYKSGRKYPVLWLLHGTFGDSTDWLRKSRIELYASERKMVLQAWL